jgi:hypothetical protein
MRNLVEDLAELADERQRHWARRVRREYGIKLNEPATWVAEMTQSRINGRDVNDRNMVTLGPSPGDVLSEAADYADGRAARRDGVGRWTLEVFGDGENSPLVLTVYPHLDEEGYPGPLLPEPDRGRES